MIPITKFFLISLIIIVFLIAQICWQEQQFYPAIIQVTQSRPILGILYMQSLAVCYILSLAVQHVFFGVLRHSENELLTEQMWYALSETFVSFTVFRDNFSAPFVLLYALLLRIKSYHWLLEGRVEFMERTPVITRIFHIRIISATIVFGLIDTLLLLIAYNSVTTSGPSVQLLFGFEYAALLISLLYTIIKYVLNLNVVVGMNSDKTLILLCVELLMYSFKVLMHLMFTVLLVKLRVPPLFAFRPMYNTLNYLKDTITALMQYRRAVLIIANLIPNATEEDVSGGDLCIICREELNIDSKKLPCGHVMHTPCLQSWFQRQQTCPTCRYDLLSPPVVEAAALDEEPAPVLTRPQLEGETTPSTDEATAVLRQVKQMITKVNIKMEQIYASLSTDEEENLDSASIASTSTRDTTFSRARRIKKDRLKTFIKTTITKLDAEAKNPDSILNRQELSGASENEVRDNPFDCLRRVRQVIASANAELERHYASLETEYEETQEPSTSTSTSTLNPVTDTSNNNQ